MLMLSFPIHDHGFRVPSSPEDSCNSACAFSETEEKGLGMTVLDRRELNVLEKLDFFHPFIHSITAMIPDELVTHRGFFKDMKRSGEQTRQKWLFGAMYSKRRENHPALSNRNHPNRRSILQNPRWAIAEHCCSGRPP